MGGTGGHFWAWIAVGGTSFPVFRRCGTGLLATVFLLLAVESNSQTVTSPQAQGDYAALLARVKQGDPTVDFRAFRIAGALASGRLATAMAYLADRAAFEKLFGARDYQGSLEAAIQSLNRNYASTVG